MVIFCFDRLMPLWRSQCSQCSLWNRTTSTKLKRTFNHSTNLCSRLEKLTCRLPMGVVPFYSQAFTHFNNPNKDSWPLTDEKNPAPLKVGSEIGPTLLNNNIQDARVWGVIEDPASTPALDFVWPESNIYSLLLNTLCIDRNVVVGINIHFCQIEICCYIFLTNIFLDT